MTDSLSPLFVDRTMRLAVLPDEQRLAFQTLEKESGDPAFADRQFSALWMSKRTGLPQEEVLKNFDGLAARYFGEGTTPTQAYDRIAATYKPQGVSGQGDGGENAPKGQESPLMAGGTVIAKDVAGSFAGGASRMGYDTLGGFYSNLAAVTGVTMKRPQDNEEYRQLTEEMRSYDAPDVSRVVEPVRAGPVQSMGFTRRRTPQEFQTLFGADTEALPKREAEIKARLSAIQEQVQAENMAALEAAAGTFRKGYSENARKIATTMYDLSRESLNAYGVRNEFQESTVGQLVATAGSLPVTALYASLGPYLGAGGIYASIYGGVEQERMEAEGDAYDPQAAFLGNLASAGPQAAMEFAFGMERVMGKIIKMSPKVGGRIAFGDAARLMGKTGLVAGVEEALTEPAQGFWNDWVASLTYDEKRELLSEDVLKTRIVESASAFALGFLFGGAVQGVQIVDRNRTATKAERFLTTRDGNLLEAPDFAALRSAKTDEELRAMASDPSMADTLVAAANGNVEAQAAYRQETLAKAFVDTDGLAAQGFTIGKVGEFVAVRDGAGRITTIDPADPVAGAFLREVQGEAIAQKEATDATLAQSKERFGETLEIESAVESPTLREMVDQGTITIEEAEDALETAKAINGLAAEATLETARPQGQAKAKVDASGVVRMVVQIAQGKDPTVAVEEVAEAWKHKAVKDGKLDPAELTEARKKWHADNNEADPTEVGKVSASRADTEWFSKRVIDYALANRKTELPDGWSKWLRAIGDRLREVLKGAAKMKKLMRDGKLDPKLESWFQAALGGEQLAEPKPSASQQVPMQGERGGVMSTFSLSPDYGIEHRPRDDGPRAFDLSENNMMPSDVYEHPEWYSSMSPKVIRETMAQLRKVRGKPDGEVTIYRAGPAGEMNPGDWVSLSREYARTHADSQDPEGYKVWAAKVKAEDVKWSMDDLSEFGYFGDKVGAQDAGVTFSLSQTETPAFREWFKGSRVVDADGNPLVVYHGTDGRSVFSKANRQVWLTADPDVAEHYAGFNQKALMPLFAQIQNPLEARSAEDVKTALKSVGWTDEQINQVEDDLGGESSFSWKWIQEGGKEVVEGLKAAGFDGAKVYDDYANVDKASPLSERGAGGQYEHQSWVSFDPSQIKSAIGNRGSFDPANPDITFSLEDVTFAVTGIPQTKKQQLQRTFNQILARQASQFPYPYHQLAALPIQAKVSLGGHEAGLAGRVLLPVSERLRFIADKAGQRIGILTRVRRYYSEKGTNLRRYSDQVTPLMRGLTRMNAVDLREFGVAASNQDALARDAVLAKYGLQNEWASYEAARDSLRNEMIAAGMEVGDIGEYFPRWVKDVTGLRQSMGINADDGVLAQAVIDAEKSAGRPLRDEEVNAVIDGAVRGVSYGAKGGSAPSNTKQRKIAVIQPNQWQFYADPNHALTRWLNQSTEAIARYRFFGKAAQQLTPQQVINPTASDLDVSIGTILAEEVAAGNLPATAQAEVKAMLDGLFSYHGRTNAWIRGFMDLSYWATMGKLSSALAQATDLMVSVYEAGPWNTAIAIPEAVWRNAKALPGIGNVKTFSEAVAKFTKGKDWLTREELGIDRIMEEFNDQRFTTRALNQVFTATGLNFMDGIGKDVLLNAKFRQLTQQAKSFRSQTYRNAGNTVTLSTGKGMSASNVRMLEGIFGKQKAQEVIADFAANRKNADTIFAVYNVLADWQPISLAEYPEAYAKNPNARVLYMLKSYSIKMLAAYRREGIMKMWYGSPQQKMEGARNLTYLLAMLFMAGASKDWLVDFMLDRDPQLEDVMVDNIFKLMQVSRYALWQQRNRNTDEGIYGGVGAAAQIAGNIKQIGVDMIAPPFTLIERPMKDVKAWAKASEDYEPWSFYEAESIQFIPVAGEFLYWTGPTGQAKIERRRALRERD